MMLIDERFSVNIRGERQRGVQAEARAALRAGETALH